MARPNSPIRRPDNSEVTYTYDRLYRLTREDITDPVFGNEAIYYGYDAENRLAFIDDGTKYIAYAYDAEGIRVSSEVDGAVMTYLVDKNRDYAQILEERDAQSSLTVQYVYGDDLISQDRAGSV